LLSIPGIENLPPAVKYVVAFVIIFVLLALFALVLRRLTGGRIALQGNDRDRTRTRQPRLGIVDVYDLDRQRQLVLLRRDNVEHLLLIGGPNDVVIETNIVRASARALPGAEAGERIDNGERIETARPVLESAWPTPALAAAATPPPAADANGGQAAAEPPPLQKSLAQFLRRGNTAGASPPANAPAPGLSTPAQGRMEPIRPTSPAIRPKPAAASSENGRAAEESPPRPAAAGEGKLPFGMRPVPRLKPEPKAPRPAPPRAGAPAPVQNENAPVAVPPLGPVAAPISTGVDPGLVDTELLSDMAKQLEQALRRPPAADAEPAEPIDAEPPVAPPRPAPPRPARFVSTPRTGNGERPPRTSPEGQPARPVLRPPAPHPLLTEEAPLGPSTALEPIEEPTVPPTVATQPELEPEPTAALTPAPEPFRFDVPRADEDAAPTVAPGPPPEIVEQTDAEEPPRPAPEPEPVAAEHAAVATQPPPEAAPSRVDPFSMEEIEAEFARLLGRPLDRR
jgi:flagellar protein FliO/FliZ